MKFSLTENIDYNVFENEDDGTYSVLIEGKEVGVFSSLEALEEAGYQALPKRNKTKYTKNSRSWKQGMFDPEKETAAFNHAMGKDNTGSSSESASGASEGAAGGGE